MPTASEVLQLKQDARLYSQVGTAYIGRGVEQRWADDEHEQAERRRQRSEDCFWALGDPVTEAEALAQYATAGATLMEAGREEFVRKARAARRETELLALEGNPSSLTGGRALLVRETGEGRWLGWLVHFPDFLAGRAVDGAVVWTDDIREAVAVGVRSGSCRPGSRDAALRRLANARTVALAVEEWAETPCEVWSVPPPRTPELGRWDEARRVPATV